MCDGIHVWNVGILPSVFLLRMYWVPFSERWAWSKGSKVHGKDSRITNCFCFIWCVFLQSFPLYLREVAYKQISRPHPVFWLIFPQLFQIIKHKFPCFCTSPLNNIESQGHSSWKPRFNPQSGNYTPEATTQSSPSATKLDPACHN